jgi:hypothetical protein
MNFVLLFFGQADEVKLSLFLSCQQTFDKASTFLCRLVIIFLDNVYELLFFLREFKDQGGFFLCLFLN